MTLSTSRVNVTQSRMLCLASRRMGNTSTLSQRRFLWLESPLVLGPCLTHEDPRTLGLYLCQWASWSRHKEHMVSFRGSGKGLIAQKQLGSSSTQTVYCRRGHTEKEQQVVVP